MPECERTAVSLATSLADLFCALVEALLVGVAVGAVGLVVAVDADFEDGHARSFGVMLRVGMSGWCFWQAR